MTHTTTEQRARSLARAQVPWDDVRARRVLERIEAQVPARARARRRGRVAAVTAAAVALAAVVVAMFALPSSPREEPLVLTTAAADRDADTDAVALAPTPSIPFVTWPQLRLPDDSVAQLRHGARVEVDVQQDDLVRLSQHGGEVRYQVTPDRTRSFVVDAAGIEVRVVGTIFTVTLDDAASRVAVQVERGLVEVDNGTRVAELGPGDALSLDVEDEVVLLEPEPDLDEPSPASVRPSARTMGPSVDALLAAADAARAGGDLTRAAEALGELVRRYPRDPRAYSAYFQLGKVERARGRHAAAAAAFIKCAKRSPRGALTEDARAEAAVSWQAAGRPDRARAAAEDYLERHRSGAHGARMRSLLADLP
ncbi:MAG: tetratricopeptide repeat protein [Nannocystaceae bacterium]